MKIEEQFEVGCRPSVVYQDINDVGGIGKCIAGVVDVEVVTKDESRWRVEASVGFMAITVDLLGRIVERRDDSYVAFTATGRDVDVAGHIALEETEGGTRCKVVLDIEPTGALAPLANTMARGVQQRLVAETIANVRERLTGLAGVGATRDDQAPAVTPTSGQRPGQRLSLRVPERLVMGIAAIWLLASGYLLGRRRGPRRPTDVREEPQR